MPLHDVAGEHEKSGSGGGIEPGRDSSELLDLVRSAEDGARVSYDTIADEVAAPLAAPTPQAVPDEEYVDVGDDAVEAPASLTEPPARPSVLPTATASAKPRALLESAPARVEGGLSPLLAIGLLFIMAVATLALVTR